MTLHARSKRSGLIGGAVLALLAIVATASPWMAPYSALAIVGAPLELPSHQHVLGTDRLGRDLLSRVMNGARLSLGGAAASLSAVAAIGLLLGSLAGFYGRLLDTVIMRIVDTVLAIPSLLLALAVAGLLRPGLFSVIAAIATVWWARYARVSRALVRSCRERDYVVAGRALGASDVHIFRRHILPQILPPILALSAQEFGTLILAVASLSFLGLGMQPPTPEWGTMISDARSVFLVAPHVLLAPAAAITLTVLAFNLVGDYIAQQLIGDHRAAPTDRG